MLKKRRPMQYLFCRHNAYLQFGPLIRLLLRVKVVPCDSELIYDHIAHGHQVIKTFVQHFGRARPIYKIVSMVLIGVSGGSNIYSPYVCIRMFILGSDG